MKDYLKKMAEEWTSELVGRHEIGSFTGGLLNSSTMANYGSRGKGPRERLKVGHYVWYQKDALLKWLESHCVDDG